MAEHRTKDTDAKFPGFRKPNTTDTPDEWYLAVAPKIRHMSEMKVMLYIIYRTFGWRKWDDWISISQFENGLNGKFGDRGCGLAVPAILDGLERALEDGYVRRRILCPHCANEVHKTEKEARPWKNRHGAGVREIAVVPVFCPHCDGPLRGQEQPHYRLAFEDDIVKAYSNPQQYLDRYKKGKGKDTGGHLESSSAHLESSSPHLESSSPHLESSSSEPEKLENSRSHSPLLHSPEHSPNTLSKHSARDDAADTNGLGSQEKPQEPAPEPVDPLTHMFEFATREARNKRPAGWEGASDEVFAVCRRVADYWQGGILPSGKWGDRVEKAQAGAAELLRYHDGDLVATLETLDAYHEHYLSTSKTITIVSPFSLVNVIPAFMSSRARGDEGSSFDPLTDPHPETELDDWAMVESYGE